MADYKKQQQQIKEATEKLEAGIREFLSSDKFREYLNVMSRFHTYSYSNAMLIALQRPDATLVAGFNRWKSMKRYPMRGEHGIRIFAPAPVKTNTFIEREKIDPDTKLPVLDEDGNPVMESVQLKRPAYKVVTVFDVSQTDGEPLPELDIHELTGSVEQFEQFFEALKRTSTVPIDIEPMQGSQFGYFDPTAKRIAIREGIGQVQMVKTAVHELAHSRLHDLDSNAPLNPKSKPKDRETKEVEAESVAYTVCQHFGIDTGDYSFGYVATWSSGRDLPELKASLNTIRTAAASLINDIESHLRDLQMERSEEIQQEVSTEGEPLMQAERSTIAQENPLPNWQYTIIPDMMTWAKPGEGIEMTPLESFSTLDDAISRFRELRNEPYNSEPAMNQNTQLPYARLSLGIQRNSPPSAMDLLHVMDDKNVLIEDFTYVESQPEVLEALSRVGTEIGYQQVFHHRTMSPEEVKAWTYSHLADQLQHSSLTEIQQASYLEKFDELYESGQMDSLKPSIRQQEITELVDFDHWDNPYFEVNDTKERLSADLVTFMAEYDSYSAITYDEAQTALSTGKTEFLHDWLTTVVQEDGAYSDKAAQLLNRMDSLCCTSELEQETTPPEIPEPEEASFRVSSMYLHIQRASDDSWDYTLYDSQLAEIDGGQVGDASMTFAQAKADILQDHNLQNAEQAEVPLNQFENLLEEREQSMHCPVYPLSLMEARSRGEMDEWRKSHNANCACAQQFRQEYGLAYHDRKVPEFLNDMVEKYGMERCKIVVASNIQLAMYDGRYSQEVKDAASQVVVPEASTDSFHDRRMDYITNCHPVMLNTAMRDLVEMEQGRGQEKVSQPKKEPVSDRPKERASLLSRLKDKQQILAGTSDKNPDVKRSKPEL